MKRKLKFCLSFVFYCFMKLVHMIRYRLNKKYRAECDKVEWRAKLLVTCNSIAR